MKTKSNQTNIAFSITEFVIGIILLLRPKGFTALIIVLLGVVLMALGTISVINYFRKDKLEAMKTNLLSKGLLCLLLGVFFAFNSSWLILSFPVTTVLYGIFMMLVGVVKFQTSIDSLRFKVKCWYINLAGALITLVCSVLIIANPFSTTEFIWKFIAISMLVEAAVDIISYILVNKSKKAITSEK